MKKVFSVLICVVVVFATSCKNNQKETNATNAFVSNETEQEINTLETLKQRKIEIDTFMSQNSKNITVLVKLIDQPNLFKVENDNFPEPYDIETTFNIVKNDNGKIIYACEIPQSQSGDWFVVLNYYFDDNGTTFAFEKQTNSFSSMCAEITYETKTEYFDENLKSIGNDYKLVGDKNKKLNKKDCDLMDYKYKILSSANSFIKTNKIKNTHKVFHQSMIKNDDETESITTSHYNQEIITFEELEYYSKLDDKQLYIAANNSAFSPSYSDQYTENGEVVSIMRFKQQLEQGTIILERLNRLMPSNQYAQKAIVTKIITTDKTIKDNLLDYLKTHSFKYMGKENRKLCMRK
jgi:hypothetical protein